MKKALITGITGQDGSYLAELLLTKGYEVHGLIRRSSSFNTHRIDHIYVDRHSENANLYLHFGDLSDSGHITNLIHNIQPDEIYHLGAQSHVRVSFDMPEYTGDIVAMGTTRILETIRKGNKNIKFYQASSSEMFGTAKPPQNETTPFQPASPYACAKLYSYWMVENYRKGYGIFACNGILFNHESPRRGETFVTRKITRAVANIIAGKQNKLYLGNIDAKRDWGYAPEYVEAMWLMLQQEKADDYVIGTEESRSVREFITEAFTYVGIEIEWQGTGEEEKGIIRKIAPYNGECNNNLSIGDCVILIDPKYFRPTEVDYLLSDTTKTKQNLGWKPRITFCDLVKIMVDYDLLLMGQVPVGEGIEINRDKGFHWTENKLTAG